MMKKRIIKIIDDCGTYSKAEYLANISRAFANGLVDINEFFKVAQSITNLTEEDLLFIANNITEEVVSNKNEYCEEYQAAGVMSIRAGGYVYSKRAFLLRNYALRYEGKEIWPTREIPGRPMDSRYQG